MYGLSGGEYILRLYPLFQFFFFLSFPFPLLHCAPCQSIRWWHCLTVSVTLTRKRCLTVITRICGCCCCCCKTHACACLMRVTWFTQVDTLADTTHKRQIVLNSAALPPLNWLFFCYKSFVCPAIWWVERWNSNVNSMWPYWVPSITNCKPFLANCCCCSVTELTSNKHRWSTRSGPDRSLNSSPWLLCRLQGFKHTHTHTKKKGPQNMGWTSRFRQIRQVANRVFNLKVPIILDYWSRGRNTGWTGCGFTEAESSLSFCFVVRVVPKTLVSLKCALR